MKKFIIGLIATIMMAMPSTSLIAGSGDTAAGVAAGLIGGAMITGIASQSGRGAQQEAAEARREAERAQMETEQLRREQMRDKYQTLERRMEKRHYTHGARRTINLLLFAIFLLFLGLIALGVMVLKKK